MKKPVKEIAFGLLIVGAILGGIYYFYRNIQAGKRTEAINLYHLVASPPEMLIRVNRPQLSASLVFSHREIETLFLRSVPEIYLDLIRQSLSDTPCLLTMHPQGVLFYTKAGTETMNHYEENVLWTHFPAYEPLRETEGKITYTLYPDTANRFFGCYYHEGIFVAGYNLKQLKETAAHQCNLPVDAGNMLEKTHAFDRKAPINILFSSGQLNLHFPLNDSIFWHPANEWITTDLFVSEGKVCVNGTIPLPRSIHSDVWQVATDTIRTQIDRRFPTLRIDLQIRQEENALSYTGCTSSPS